MAKVRKKSAYPEFRFYFKRARMDGIGLSWNFYEKMLPQDGFSRLGLSCFDCLSGPCRINPFLPAGERTICGFEPDDLVYRTLMRFLDAPPESGDPWESIKKAAFRAADSCSLLGGGRVRVGPGVLEQDKVNICVQNARPELLAKLEAVDIKLSTAGRVVPGYDAAAASGDAEFVIMTGMVDAYVTGKCQIALPRAAARSYHTVFIEDSDAPRILAAARAAMKRRDAAKIRPDSRVTEITVVPLKDALARIKDSPAALIGGGGNIKQTLDELALGALRALSEKGIACLLMGGAAAALAKYDLAGPNIFYCAGEAAALLEDMPVREKTAVLLPDIMMGSRLGEALALGMAGYPVLTATEIPLGNGILGERIAGVLPGAAPEEYVSRALALFGF
jgi:hypothetical protein